MYNFYAYQSTGLKLDKNSMDLSVNGRSITALDPEQDEWGGKAYIMAQDDDELEEQGFSSVILVQLLWKDIYENGETNPDGEFIFPEDAAIELTFSATVTESAKDTVFSRAGWYGYGYLDGTSEKTMMGPSTYYSQDHQATGVLSPAIAIRRVDGSDNSLAGTKYTIDGIIAKKIGDGIYEYSPDDGVDEFETDKSGLLVVTKVPIGTYAITESFTPAGHAPEKQSITQTITSDTIEITYGNKKHFQPIAGIDIDSYVTTFDDGNMGLDLSAIGEGREMTFNYDSDTGAFVGDDAQIKKTESGYVLSSPYIDQEYVFQLDNTTGKYTAYISEPSEIMEDFEVNKGVSIRMKFEDTDGVYNYDAKDKCYKNIEYGSMIMVCEDGDAFDILVNQGQLYRVRIIPSGTGLYAMEGVGSIYSIEREDGEILTLKPYYVIHYSENLDKYFLSIDGPMQIALAHSPETYFAINYLFRDKTNNVAPEAITNPQTSDAIAKILVAAIACITSAVLVKRALSRR